MSRAEAVSALKSRTGIADPLALADFLQAHGLVADQCVSPKDMATEDLCAAVDRIEEMT